MYFDKPKLLIEMHIEGKEVSHFLSFNIRQRFNAHHEFELRIEHGKLGIPGLINLQDSRSYVGRTLAISFGYAQQSMQNFSGIITEVSLTQSYGYQGVLQIKGYSPTILIDRGKDLGSYFGKSLGDIVKLATGDVVQNDLHMSVNPSRSEPIDYLIQYRESDFEFLNRLSAEYLEWFYYDGERLHFGMPSELPAGKVTYGREVSRLDYGIQIRPINHRRFSYLPQHDQLLESTSNVKSDGHPDQVFAMERASETFSKVFSQPLDIRVDTQGELQRIVQQQEEANVGQLLQVSCDSDSPSIRLGAQIEIETSLRQDLGFVTDTLGKFLITEVEHHFDDVGRYTNRFNGILASTERIPVREYIRPQADMQMADVIDNNDPSGQGRIRVRFKWQCANNDETEWLRIITPNAGTGDRGVNRGFLSIPEIGDHVIVAFEEGSVARPVVLGSLYNQSTADSTPQMQNHLKSITTRSGHLIEFDDSQSTQGIKITDIKGNIVHIDSQGSNVTITALENMTLNCKNMQINVTENMDVQVGKDQSTSVGNNQTVSVTKDIATTAGNNYSLTATGDISEDSDNRTEIASKDFNRQSETSNELASEMTIFSNKENMTLQSGKTIEINSVEKSKLF